MSPEAAHQALLSDETSASETEAPFDDAESVYDVIRWLPKPRDSLHAKMLQGNHDDIELKNLDDLGV